MNEDLFYSVNIDQIAKTTAVDQINTDFKYIQKTMEKELKCVVLGNEGVGKTCLIAKFTTDLFPCEEKALDESSAVLEVPRSNGTMDRCTMKIHDMDITTEAYKESAYDNTDVFMICFAVDDRDSLKAVTTRWIPEIMKARPLYPLVVVGTKADLDQVPELGGAVKAMMAAGASKYLECSAKTEDGVKQAFERAASAGLDGPKLPEIPKVSKSCNVL